MLTSNDPQTIIRITLSGRLWDRTADSIGQEHGREYGRQGGWSYRRMGFGGRYSIDAPRAVARRVLEYIESIARLDGSGMDPEEAADTRAEAAAAKAASRMIRVQLGK